MTVSTNHIAISIILLSSILIANIAIPAYGYVIVGGYSMDPTYETGCNLVLTEPWDGESSLENEVVAYKLSSQNVESYPIMLGIDLDINWFSHRVVEEYEHYDMKEANHTLLNDNQLMIQDEYSLSFMETPQEIEDVKNLEGEHVLILKGDNNDKIDPAIVPADNVLTKLETDTYIHLQDIDSWPCSVIK